MAEQKKETAAYELFVVCKSKILILQGSDPTAPSAQCPDFYAGDVFQARQSSEYPKFMQLRVASKSHRKQWLPLTEEEATDDTESKPVVKSVMKIVPPSVSEYYHLDIGMTATRKCKVLESVVRKAVDTVYGLNLSVLSGALVGFLPFSYPIFTICGTLFRGRGQFTQFCVPYFMDKKNCQEFIRRLKLLTTETVDALEGRTMDETARLQMEIEWETKLMMKSRERMGYALKHDPEEQTTENEELFEMDDEEKEREEALDAHALNEIVSVKKEQLPKWITSVFGSIPTPKGFYFCIELYFMESYSKVEFAKDEYLEQNEHGDFEIKNEDEGNTTQFVWREPRLVATKQADNLEELIEVNEAGGSRWFDVQFDAKKENVEIYLDDCDFLNCRAGGKWQVSFHHEHHVSMCYVVLFLSLSMSHPI